MSTPAMPDLEFMVLMKLRRIPQRRRHFLLLGEEHALAAAALARRGLIERTLSAEFGDAYRMTHEGRRLGQVEWIRRGRPSLEELLRKGEENFATEGTESTE